MPYTLTVLAFIVIGVGFTLFQAQTTNALTSEEIPTTITVGDLFADVGSEVSTEIEKGLESIKEIATKTPESTKSNEPVPVVTTTKPVETTPTPTPPPAPAPVAKTDYKNGTYTSSTNFRTPDGTYQINVTLTVSNDTVTGSNVSFDSKGARDSYSKRFSNSYQNQVIGRDLGNLSLSRVGGASLTTRAFNSVVAGIKQQSAS